MVAMIALLVCCDPSLVTFSQPPTVWRPFSKGRAAWSLLSSPDAYTFMLWGPLTTFPCNRVLKVLEEDLAKVASTPRE